MITPLQSLHASISIIRIRFADCVLIKVLLSSTVLFSVSALAQLDLIPENMSNWTEHGKVLILGSGDSWDSKSNHMTILGISKVRGTYYLFYLAGDEGCWNVDADIRHQAVGLATSVDGVRFTKYSGNPVLVPHAFVNVSSHEEGIRAGHIKYLPHRKKFVGYFGVESPGGTQTCSYRGSNPPCECNIAVDAGVFAAESSNGVDWVVKGDVKGVGGGEGVENYADSFEYIDGEYVFIGHVSEGPEEGIYVSKASNWLNLDFLGSIPELCIKNTTVKTFLHNDNDKITVIFKPKNPVCKKSLYNSKGVFFGTLDKDYPRKITNIRMIHVNTPSERDNHILKDTVNGAWRW